MEKVKVLCILNSLELCNGIVSYAMNYYKNLDKNKIKMDFLVTNNTESPYFELIEGFGDNIFILPELKYKNTKAFLTQLDKFFKKNNNYDIVHCHIANASVFYLKYAKKYGIKKRILHSHATESSDKLLRKIRNDIMIKIGKNYANYYFACSKAAGEAMFKSSKYQLINNAIDTHRYKFNESIRRKKREELNLEGKYVIGCIGRFAKQKNQLFLIDIFKEVVISKRNSILLLIGSGDMESDIKEKIREYNIEKNVKILKNRSDVSELYQAIDVFLLPSLYEGLPVVGIEAQCADLPLIVSDSITKELKLLESTKFISLKSDIKVWKDSVINSKKNRVDNTKNLNIQKYDIKMESKKLQNLYEEIYKE